MATAAFWWTALLGFAMVSATKATMAHAAGEQDAPLPGTMPTFEEFKHNASGMAMTTNHGLPISDDENSLKLSARGPTLLEDFFLHEKLNHFDRERIPERVVHARGTAAHGYFQAYDDSLKPFTRAKFLTDPSLKTPVFVRFSTVVGSRGSADTVRDVRGFATKFYTQEGNFDLVANNLPVFFIQDTIKFMDLIHAIKPEPHNEIPQAQSAHSTFHDFVANQPETAHMLMWLFSDRTLPRAYANMQGFGVNTFRLVNEQGESHYVKFHWKPVAGLASLVFDEAQKLAGKDPDFHRRGLWESIEDGDFPMFELGMQIFNDQQANSFDFDILDATKLIPEEQIPVKLVGRMVLNRNVDYFFGETEQVAFCVSRVVPGIDFSDDPLLQGRVFSYLDTQVHRLGGPNFPEIPINRPICPFANNQRDGFHRTTMNVGRTNYGVNTISQGWPKTKPADQGSFATYPERVDGQKLRVRSPTFADYFSQATMLWNSFTAVEKKHALEAWTFDLMKVDREDVRQRVLNEIVANISPDLAAGVALRLGMPATAPSNIKRTNSAAISSPLLSTLNPKNMAREVVPSKKLATRKVAILAADGVNPADIQAIRSAVAAAGGKTKILSVKLGSLQGGVMVDSTMMVMPSVMFDAVAVPGGKASVDALLNNGGAVHFIAEAYMHAKPIAASGEGQNLLIKAGLQQNPTPEGVFVGDASSIAIPFVDAISRHRAWGRPDLEAISA